MFTEYAIYPENLSLNSFITLVKNAWRTNSSIAKQRGDLRRKRGPSMNSAWEEVLRTTRGWGRKLLRKSHHSYVRWTIRAILDRWIKVGNIKLLKVNREPTTQEKNDPRYYKYYRIVNHATKDCRNLRWIFLKRIYNVELIIEDDDVHMLETKDTDNE